MEVLLGDDALAVGQVLEVVARHRPNGTVGLLIVGRTLVEECVDRLAAPDRKVRPIWLPPLPSALALGPLAEAADRNLCAHRFRQPGTGCSVCTADGRCAQLGGRDLLQVPMGLLDQPTVQRQDPWRLDLGRAGGHVAVIGAPQSGRTTFLQTLAASVALTHYLPSARDLGLHVILARPVAGAARAAYDMVLQTLRNTGGTTTIMSGERSEGQIIPSVYAAPLPPGRAGPG